MVTPLINNKARPNDSESIKKLLFVLSGIFLFIISLTIFQDFLESKRNGYMFYVSESLLFKTIWVLFIPILAILYKRLKKDTSDSFAKTATLIVSPIVIHLFILPFIAIVISVLFYQGRYDLYKFFSYTLAHDLYILVIVYTSFVLGYKYFSNRTQSIAISESRPTPDTIVVNNGKDNVVVNVENIIQITSATPYIFIHLENNKYLHSETLKSICGRFDNNVFVRVHKSTVVNISKVSSFKSRLNGDYDLQLENGELVRLSRTYTPDFKKRFNAR
tara:strand:+ start:2087 stop:2911 length:825 start_codon:yes stop_codon:yes gene_type:complete